MSVMIMGIGGSQKTAGVICNSSNKVSEVALPEKYKVPAVPSSGNYSQTFEVSDLSAANGIMNQGDEVIIPDIFTTADVGIMPIASAKTSYLYTNGLPSNSKKISWAGEGTADVSGVWIHKGVTEVNVSHADRIDNQLAISESVSNTHAAIYASKKIVVNAQAATYMNFYWPVTTLNTTHVYPEVINEGIVSLDSTTYPRQFPFYTNASSGSAIMRFNGAKTVNFHRQTMARGGSFYFPVIESLSATGISAVYGIELYLGPNMSTLNNSTKFAASNNVNIHIPAGNSTTKTTLDNAGLTYTQDYVIQ